jgi:hypothetical protein
MTGRRIRGMVCPMPSNLFTSIGFVYRNSDIIDTTARRAWRRARAAERREQRPSRRPFLLLPRLRLG